jgi:hypothetical protein
MSENDIKISQDEENIETSNVDEQDYLKNDEVEEEMKV